MKKSESIVRNDFYYKNDLKKGSEKMPLANKLELEQALRARLLVNSISSKDTKHSIVNRTKRLFKKNLRLK